MKRCLSGLGQPVLHREACRNQGEEVDAELLAGMADQALVLEQLERPLSSSWMEPQYRLRKVLTDACGGNRDGA